MSSGRSKSGADELVAGVRSIAVAGVSSKSSKFGSMAARELKKRGFEVYPIHPTLDQFDGQPCYRSVEALPEAPDCLLVSVHPERAVELVDQAVARGIKAIWFQQGADFSEAVKRAREKGLRTIEGRCILMYAGEVSGIHNLHRFFSRIFGKY